MDFSFSEQHVAVRDTVRGKIDRLLEETGCNYVIGSFAWGSLPLAASQFENCAR